MEFDQFKGMHIQILEWTFFKEAKESDKYREAYSIGSEYRLIASTITGDIIAIKENELIQIDHEDAKPENDYRLSKNLKKVKSLIEETIEIAEHENCEEIKSLKSIKKQIKACMKIAPKNLKDDYESALDDIKDQIYFLQD